MKPASINQEFYIQVRDLLEEARRKAYSSVNRIMVEAYWHTGRLIVEEEQKGEDRAEYGKGLIKELSKRLTEELGKGFNTSNLKRMRQFYLTYPKSATLSHLLSWSHYRLLITVDNERARDFYQKEAESSHWSVRALKRQIDSLYFERLLMSREKEPVIKEADDKTAELPASPKDVMKDPFVLEFLNLKNNSSFRESELEAALIGELGNFLLEMGRGFAFVARQKRIKSETKDFYIDLVFYHYLLKCFVLIDLKTGSLTHQDIGQMDMYIRMYDQLEKAEGDNPTVGIILCTNKDETVVKFSMLQENQNLLASRYQLYLPTVEELQQEIEREKAWYESMHGGGDV